MLANNRHQRYSFTARLTRSEERRVGKECRCTRWTGDWSSDVCSSDLTPDTVKAVVSLYGWSDLTHPTVREFYWNELFLGKKYEDAPTLYKEASPITHVGKQSPPTLLIHGTIDKIGRASCRERV